MSVNSSSTNDSLLHPNLSSIDSYPPPVKECYFPCTCNLMYLSYFVTFILLLLPLCILVLYLGLQRRQQQHSTSTSATTSHSDTFTYHMVTMELVAVLGAAICCCGIYRSKDHITKAGYFVFSLGWYGETYFQILTCVERYLAVVHPIFYLGLRGERGVRIRNISIGFAWLLSCVGVGLTALENASFALDFCLVIFCLIIVVFCSLSVLCVLIRPGPGQQSEDRQRVDQSKRRAFYTIVAILVVVFWRCLWNQVWAVLQLLGRGIECPIMAIEIYFNLPCSLVLPLLFLHRAGRLACCKNNTK